MRRLIQRRSGQLVAAGRVPGRGVAAVGK
jgi:hypothetical protein